MRSRFLIRLEWISLVYLALFVLAVLSPSLVTRDVVGIDERHVEEILIFLFGIVGLATFSIYQRLMERREKEHEDAKNEYERARRELIESYQYIGSINRQIELLKRLANQTSQTIIESSKLNKDLLASLLANAAASVNAKTAYIRYVDVERLRTVHETLHTLESQASLKLANKDLKKVHEFGATHAFMRAEDGREILVVPSDSGERKVKAYLVVATDPSRARDFDISLLKVFANQAELLHHILSSQSASKPGSPLALVEQAERQVVGEVR